MLTGLEAGDLLVVDLQDLDQPGSRPVLDPVDPPASVVAGTSLSRERAVGLCLGGRELSLRSEKTEAFA
jgi:hypothetical protein